MVVEQAAAAAQAPITNGQDAPKSLLTGMIPISTTIELVGNAFFLGIVASLMYSHVKRNWPHYLRRIKHYITKAGNFMDRALDIMFEDVPERIAAGLSLEEFEKEMQGDCNDFSDDDEEYSEPMPMEKMLLKKSPAEKTPEGWEMIRKNPYTTDDAASASASATDSEYDTSSEDHVSASSDELEYQTPAAKIRFHKNEILAKLIANSEKHCYCNCHAKKTEKKDKKEKIQTKLTEAHPTQEILLRKKIRRPTYVLRK